MFDFGIKKSISYPFPVICVGNLSTGGTGKTPMIEYLIKVLKKDYRVATLSRGYKRQSKGFLLANTTSTVNDLGDEPFQFYNKFKEDAIVAVDADRNNGIKNLKQLKKDLEVVLLDDAFQHRYVNAGLNILLTTYSNLYTSDIVLPTGNLREPRVGARRAQIIVITKCPEVINKMDKDRILSRINPLAYQDVFFSRITYSNKVYSASGTLEFAYLPENFTLVTGIANASPLVRFLEGKGMLFEHLNYDDHYNFTNEDLNTFKEKSCILTTEKDYMRLKQYNSISGKLYYLPIEVVIDRPQFFEERIIKFMKSFKN